MQSRMLMVACVFVGTLVANAATAQAQIPLIRGGTPVFRAPQFNANGPQPFSTRRARELQAARARGLTTRGTVFGNLSASSRSRTATYQRAQRSAMFSRRFSRFR